MRCATSNCGSRVRDATIHPINSGFSSNKDLTWSSEAVLAKKVRIANESFGLDYHCSLYKTDIISISRINFVKRLTDSLSDIFAISSIAAITTYWFFSLSKSLQLLQHP